VFRRRFAPQELRASLREVGRTVAQEHLENVKGKSRDQRIEFALNLLMTLGGDAMGEESEGKYFRTIAWHDATRSFRVLVFQQLAAAVIF
jgi:hypothetical protein